MPTALTGFAGPNVPCTGLSSAWGFATSIVIDGLAAGLYLAFKKRGCL